jgi:hypothetical protein
MLSLKEIHKHLNIEDDFKEDDILLMQYCEAAELTIKNAIQPDHDEDLLDENGDYLPNVRHAILLLIGTWYQTRESITFGVANKFPYGMDYLI